MATERETARGESSSVPASSVVQNVRRRLMTLANLPDAALAQKRAIFQGIVDSKPSLFALDAALMGIGDDQLRRKLTDFVVREGDVEIRRGGERAALPLVAVGAYFEGPVPTEDPAVFQSMMTGSSSDLITLDFPNPERPERKALMLAVPLYEWRCLFLLYYSAVFSVSRNVPAVQEVGWAQLLKETSRPGMCYLFSPPLSEIDGTTPDWSFSGPVYDQYMATIARRIQRVNEAWPDARLTQLPAKRLSQTIPAVQERTVALSVKDELQALQMAEAESRREAEKAGRTHRPLWPEATTALVSLTTWEKDSIQTADILLLDPDNLEAPARQLRYQISGLTTVDSLRSTMEAALKPEGLIVKTLPSAPSPKRYDEPVSNHLYRDIDGRWLPGALFTRPYAGRQLVSNQKCAVLLKAESEEDLRDMNEVPAPLLFQQVDLTRMFQQHFRADVAARVFTLGDTPGTSYTQARGKLHEEYPGLRYLRADHDASLAQLGLRYDTYLAYHFKKCEGRLFHIRQALIERLDFSDIEDGVPVAYLRAPFADCYLHLEHPVEVRPGSALEDEMRLHGFYVTQQELPGRAWRLAIAPIATLGAEVLYARASEIELTLEAGDSRGLLKALNDQIHAEGQDAVLTSHDDFYRILNLSAKVLLYLGLRSARLVDRPERTRALEQVADRSPSERKRQARRSGNLYDFIEVGPEKSMRQEQAETGETLSARVFWRRGFFRMQAYGPKWTLHRQQWIQPTIVNADLLTKADELPPIRRYRVGGKTKGRPQPASKR